MPGGARQESPSQPSAIIIGAGIVGMSVALYLQEAGIAVTVVDPRDPGTACSEGNSGGFGIGLVAPIAMPGILRTVPRLLLSPDEPLFIDWRVFPRAAPWFWRFARSARMSEVRRIAAARAALNCRVAPTLAPLLEIAGAGGLVRHQGMIFLYAGPEVPAGARARFALASEHGIATETLAAEEVRRLYPAAAADIRAGARVPANMHCTDPLGLVTAYARAFLARGGILRREEVSALAPGDPPGIVAGGVTLRADHVVVAAGVWSRDLIRPLGYRVLLEAERGYHLMLPAAGIDLPAPTTLADRNIVLTPMDRGLRITGIAEFAPPEAPARMKRARRLLPLARTFFPGLDGAEAREWMGPRPSTPDSLPVVGAAPNHRGLWFAFGHGQSGLANASVTGRAMVDLIAGRDPGFDLSPYGISRFAR